ncbi:MAG: hypothetical protein FJ276_05270 [Planctomycetes bacterium]|nr:hypothetical protein [Planctomycetota bacterium]
MRRHFDMLAASRGAASLGLVALFAIAGVLVLTDPDDSQLAIGSALLILAAVYFFAMTAIGWACRPGGLLDGRFDFRAGSHGAAGFCIVSIFVCSGVLVLKDLWESSTAVGLSLLTVAALCAIGMVLSGLVDTASADDDESQLPGATG